MSHPTWFACHVDEDGEECGFEELLYSGDRAWSMNFEEIAEDAVRDLCLVHGWVDCLPAEVIVRRSHKGKVEDRRFVAKLASFTVKLSIEQES